MKSRLLSDLTDISSIPTYPTSVPETAIILVFSGDISEKKPLTDVSSRMDGDD